MARDNDVILVVALDANVRGDIKELLEFMDADSVDTATPDTWLDTLDDRHPAAIFIGPDVADDARSELLRQIGESYPDAPIVLVEPGPGPKRDAA